MDAMELARDITVAIISNPNYKPRSGEEEAQLFSVVLKALAAELAEEEVEEAAASFSEELPSVKDMRVRRSPLTPPEGI
jgi:hypothetical protein